MSKQIVKGFSGYSHVSNLTRDISIYAEKNNLIIKDVSFTVGINYFYAIVIYEELDVQPTPTEQEKK